MRFDENQVLRWVEADARAASQSGREPQVRATAAWPRFNQTVDRYGHLMPDAHIGASSRLDATVFGSGPDNSAYKPLTSDPDKQDRPEGVMPLTCVSSGRGDRI